MLFPFEVEFGEVQRELDSYIDKVFGCLESEFMVMPKGDGFIEYSIFLEGYEALKRATQGFRHFTPERAIQAVYEKPISLIILRCMLGFTPPELAYEAKRRTGVDIRQGPARTIDRKIRISPTEPLVSGRSVTSERITALVTAACELLEEGAPEVGLEQLHRLNKADTRDGLTSLQSMADLGVPYPMLLYERFLGRPFAAHRDSVSELVGDILETAIEGVLSRNRITYRKTKRAERIPRFDQAPDFIIPDEFAPQIVIEAKLTEDDGTARDKVTRVQHLASLSDQRLAKGESGFEVVACIAGRGFKQRREDMRKLLLATKGKVFTLQNINQIVSNTRLQEFQTIL